MGHRGDGVQGSRARRWSEGPAPPFRGQPSACASAPAGSPHSGYLRIVDGELARPKLPARPRTSDRRGGRAAPASQRRRGARRSLARLDVRRLPSVCPDTNLCARARSTDRHRRGIRREAVAARATPPVRTETTLSGARSCARAAHRIRAAHDGRCTGPGLSDSHHGARPRAGRTTRAAGCTRHAGRRRRRGTCARAARRGREDPTIPRPAADAAVVSRPSARSCPPHSRGPRPGGVVVCAGST